MPEDPWTDQDQFASSRAFIQYDQLEGNLSDESPVEFAKAEETAFGKWTTARDQILNDLLKAFKNQQEKEHGLGARYAWIFLGLFEVLGAFLILGIRNSRLITGFSLIFRVAHFRVIGATVVLKIFGKRGGPKSTS